MTTIRSLLFVAVSAAALACGSTHEPDTTPPVASPRVDIAIASVTLADDCGTGPTVAPPAPPAPAQEKLAQSAERSARPGAAITLADRACEQSSIQLRVANDTPAASKVTIQTVELLDEHGAKVADLTPRAPSRWADDRYQAWDEQAPASETLQVSYALSAPHVQRGATYTVRVVIAAADGERTLEQKTTLEAEASLPPGVVT
ncbi:MAG: hypothetical protein K8M05_16960 [Deltaproteobacteria bacterium]|nr:hypothetical protein [Kofleriaceae bacterium]